MPRWAEFTYREFYDVPREIVVPAHDGALLLSCPFDNDLDDYSADYELYWLPVGVDLSGSWTRLPDHAVQRLGRVPVGQVHFDVTRRRELDLESVGAVGARFGGPQ